MERYKLLLRSPALLSIQMYSTILMFWHFGQEEHNASSVYGDLEADFTYSCWGRDVLTATNSNKLSHWESLLLLFPGALLLHKQITSFSLFHLFVLLLHASLKWMSWSSPIPFIVNSFCHTFQSFFEDHVIFPYHRNLSRSPTLSVCPFALQYPLLQQAACWVILAPMAPVTSFTFNRSLMSKQRLENTVKH